jgi:hypothetical protein
VGKPVAAVFNRPALKFQSLLMPPHQQAFSRFAGICFASSEGGENPIRAGDFPESSGG